MINRAILVGRLTKDPELRRTANDIPVATFTLAVNRQFSNPSGEREADFIQCVVWRRQAETVEQYLSKGSLVGVEGRIQTRSYDDQDGNRKYITEIVCDSVQFLETKASQENSSNYNNEKESQPRQQQSKKTSSIPDIVTEDDLPF
ncbi:single-stranded DNA-binding protein [Liberiplasma polymorphum]|jgi:single-strand DNA-binding protein|uniref:single-stranded DNA-binding protein n=1 Tax=Liberiplasma polymorphum TaxID=3374570 RepID=UPI0037747CEB